MTIQLKRMRRGSPPVAVEIAYKCSYSDKSYVRLETRDGLRLEIAGTSSELARLFAGLAQACRRQTVGQQAGIIRAAPERQAFNLLEVADIRPELPDAQKIALLIERFRDSPADVYEALLADFKAVAGRAYESNGGDQLAGDLAAVEPLAGELLDDEGGLVWGGQTRIAEALGIANAGQSNRERILAVAEALREAA